MISSLFFFFFFFHPCKIATPRPTKTQIPVTVPIPIKILHDQGLGRLVKDKSDGSRPPRTGVTCSYKRTIPGRYIKSTFPRNSAAKRTFCDSLATRGIKKEFDRRG
ncbi:uncharacterized protein B0J16DRAFT_341292 [Fusarium flagelliforme]|uniref:uncharacterized protein n=1 Tax=Fusarium flagelliforme TaxID=2675880 RepID=UPI001E8EC7E1|nr:uncharacterized protein B0J16DRAFT_341292 [Fusarium flagelliforme]KAH7185299.1 hypothetical protein B0J16DRAFT_341292 [Fusarium flagelliforme]